MTLKVVPWETGTFNLRIPIGGTVESLNVSVSAALCLYETVRQRAHDRNCPQA